MHQAAAGVAGSAPSRRGRSFSTSRFWTCSRSWSTADLRIEPDGGDRAIVRLGAERVGLALNSCASEIELAADRPALGEQTPAPLGRDSEGSEPVELLADIGAGARSAPPP